MDAKVKEVTVKQLTFLKLKHDFNDTNVRIYLAHNGIALNVFINDPHPLVRHTVAKHGYKLNILKDDSNEKVRKMAIAVETFKMKQEAKKITDDIFRKAGCL